MSSQKAMINTMMFYHWDSTLFDGMLLPEGLDRSTVIDTILLETTDFPLVISDLETLRYSIELWSKHRVDIWTKLLETTQYEYNPIENYDRYEITHDDLYETGYGTVKGDGGEDRTDRTVVKSGAIIRSTTGFVEREKSGAVDKSILGSYTDANSGTDVNTNAVSAFNDSGYSDHEQSRLAHGLSVERSYNGYVETEDYTGYKETERYNNYNLTEDYGLPDSIENPTESEIVKTKKQGGERTDKNFNNNRTINGHIHGNIGVTTTQQMIEAERKVVNFDVVDQIVTDYKTTFCILIY